MDDTNPTNDANETDLMPPPEPRSGCLGKTLIYLVLIGLVIGGLIFAAVKFMSGRASQPEPEAAAPAPQTVAAPVEPAALVLARQLITADELTRKTLAPQLSAAPGSKLEAIDFLSQSLPQADPSVKTDIVTALGLLAKANSEAIPVLVNALDDKSVRHEAMVGLGALGPAGSPALPKLKKIAANKKESKSTRAAAQKAITQIQGKKPAAKAKHGKKHAKKK